MKTFFKRSGAIEIMMVIILSAIGISVSVLALLVYGVSSLRTAAVIERSYEAEATTDACAEEALQQIRDNATFTGTVNLSLSKGTCTYSVTSGNGENRTITATGRSQSLTRKNKIIIDAINPQIHVVSWQDVKEF